MLNLLEPKQTYVVEYPEALVHLKKQMGIFWFPDEVHVEKDVQDILVNLTPSERHGVTTTLKLFTKYELIVGVEYWQKVAELFPKPACIARMANGFSFIELNVHAPFYSKINEALGLANDKFYSEYLEDPELTARMHMLEGYAQRVDRENPESVAEFLAMLAMTEGVILYASFAFLKHFQSQGKNRVLNIVRGINFSARDEGIHSDASAWLFGTFLGEQKDLNHELLGTRIREMADTVRKHEFSIIEKIFEKGNIDGITIKQCQHFVDSRLNLVLRSMGYENMYKVDYNPIGEWFYKGMNNYQSNDFFSGQGREYGRNNWDADALTW